MDIKDSAYSLCTYVSKYLDVILIKSNKVTFGLLPLIFLNVLNVRINLNVLEIICDLIHNLKDVIGNATLTTRFGRRSIVIGSTAKI